MNRGSRTLARCVGSEIGHSPPRHSEHHGVWHTVHMMPDAASAAHATLLTQLIVAAASSVPTEAILHEQVVLHRLDGTDLVGRDPVLDAVTTRDRSVKLTVVAERVHEIDVALEVAGVPGRLVFQMAASVADGRLVEIWMRTTEPTR